MGIASCQTGISCQVPASPNWQLTHLSGRLPEGKLSSPVLLAQVRQAFACRFLAKLLGTINFIFK